MGGTQLYVEKGGQLKEKEENTKKLGFVLKSKSSKLKVK